MTILLWFLGVIGLVCVLAFSVGIHEAGHMTAAKFFKLSVPQFFIGFGPRMFSFKRNGTEYGARWIPLGGFVRIEDRESFESSRISENLSKEEKERLEKEQLEDSLLLRHVKPWKRQIIYVAGPAVNIIAGTLVLFAVLLFTPTIGVTNVVKTVDECSTTVTHCGAYEAGIEKGDKIISVAGKNVKENEVFTPLLENKKEADVVVLRDGKKETIKNVPVSDGRLGIIVQTYEKKRTVGDTFTDMGAIFTAQLKGILKLPQAFSAAVQTAFTNERNPDTPTSVVGMGKVYGDVVSTNKLNNEDKFLNLVYYGAMINLGLGFINLIPLFAPLDGFRMLIAAIDSIKGFVARMRKKKYNPVSALTMSRLTTVTILPLIIFMLVVILADIRNPISIF